jgi:hypothetical protein
VSNGLSEADESRQVDIIKEGKRTGVKISLLPENGIIISGLKAEWPPWVKLEPKENRISISLDGKNWEDRSSAADLWILGLLDPRPHIQKETGERVGVNSLAHFEARFEGSSSLNAKIEGRDTQAPRVSFDFPFSGERLTLKFSPKRTAGSERQRFNA